MRIRTEVDLKRLRRTLSRNERNQVPFAVALALTRTGNVARDEIKRQLPQKFTTRSKWTEKGVRSLKATKRHQAAYVYSRDEYMVKQELGGTVSPSSGRKLALPRGVRSSKVQKIPRSKFPSALLKQRRTYEAPLGPKGGGVRGIYKRVGRGKAATAVLQYALTPRPYKVKPRWGFADTVADVARKHMHVEFRRALDQAIVTSR